MSKKKIGRNDPCPCGSGKKYKNCCMKKELPVVDLLWRRISETLQKESDRLLKFSEKEPLALLIAADEFFLFPEDDTVQVLEELLLLHSPIFVPWFLNNWYLEPDTFANEENPLSLPPYKTFNEIYLEKRGKHLDSLQRRILEANNRRPYSFYEVMHSRPGEGLRLRDLLLGTEMDVLERLGSEEIVAGDILFARTVTIDNITILDGCGTVAIPPEFKMEILDVRDGILSEEESFTHDTLNEYDDVLRDLYFYLFETLMEEPGVMNTDGEELFFVALHYEIDDPVEAMRKLRTLSGGMSERELRETALYDARGNLVSVEIPWHRKDRKGVSTPEGSLLGIVEIDHIHLTARVNSRERAERLKKEIEKRLKGHARFILQETDTLESLVKEREEGEGENPTPFDSEELLEAPEVREVLENFFTEYWKRWETMKIPALGGETPRQAVKTNEGREKVRALFRQAEQNALRGEKISADIQLRLLKDLRKRLGVY